MAKPITGGKNGRPSSTPLPPVSKRLGDPPEGIGEIALSLWKHIQGLDWVADSDRFMVAELCRVYEMKETLRLKFDLGVQSVSVPVPNQGKRLHPEVQLMKELQAQVNALMRDLGLSPQGRKELAIAEAKKRTPLEEYSIRRIRRFQERDEK